MAQTEQRVWTNDDLAALYDRFFASLFDLAVRVVGSDDEAALILGRTFSRAAEELRRRQVDELRPWLCGLVAAELPRRRPSPPPDAHRFARVDPDRLANPEALLRDEQITERVWSAAAKLPVADYLLLDLQVRHGLRDPELARALRLDARDVERRVERLHRQLEEEVEAPVSPVAVFAALAPVAAPPGLAQRVWAGLAAPPSRSERKRPWSQVAVPRRAVLVAAIVAAVAGGSAAGAYLLARGPGVHDPAAVRSTDHRTDRGSDNPWVAVVWTPSTDARGYSVSWSAQQETPDKVVDLPGSASGTTGHLHTGTSWFNLRTLGTNGRWTSTVHLGPFLILPDTTVPDTTISGSPGRLSSPQVTFRFSSTEQHASLECSLDGEGFTPCTSPKTYGRLRPGTHAFRVRSVDEAGNVDPTPARHAWRVDAKPPETTLVKSPPDYTNDAARFVFRSSEHHSTFECKLDGGSFVACSSPKTYRGLADGLHRLRVRAVDRAGNSDPSPVKRAWTRDTAPPETAFAHGPGHISHRARASFALSSEPGATFQCRLDRGVWTDCSPVTGLTDGTHVMRARAVDPAGNVDPTPARWFWTVDLPPQTTITAAPPSVAASASAVFRFTSDDPAATFECRLDDRSWAGCASGKTYTRLSQGSHTFRARAKDAGGTVDRSPARRTWTVDTVAPKTTIDSGPPKTTKSSSATFSFSSPDSGATFQCRLDSGSWRTCSSPRTYRGLAKGAHVFRVRAVDAAGNVDASPSKWSWTVS